MDLVDTAGSLPGSRIQHLFAILPRQGAAVTTMISKNLVFLRDARAFRRCDRFAHFVRWKADAGTGRDRLDRRRLRALIGVEALRAGRGRADPRDGRRHSGKLLANILELA